MKKSVYAYILIFLCSLQLLAQSSLQESLSIKSKILGRDVKYCIYLPDGYQNSSRRYPVLYLLHGYTDNETGWVQFGNTQAIADKSISSNETPAMIIVMPDAGVTWYMNDYQGKERYEDMFFKELIPYIDSLYRTRAKKEFRAIAGLSMGGHGTALYAMHQPQMFAAAAPLSAAFFPDEDLIAMPDDRYDNIFAKLLGTAKGTARTNAHWKKNNTLDLAKTLPEADLKSVRWYFDCGDDDFLYKGNAQMHTILSDRKIPHEYRMRDGGHTWSYWRTALPDVLKFVGQSFQR